MHVVDLVPCPGQEHKHGDTKMPPRVTALLYPKANFKIAKQFWQHTGEGISSRRAEYCHALFREGLLVPKSKADIMGRTCKGPKRYQRSTSVDLTSQTINGSGLSNSRDNVRATKATDWSGAPMPGPVAGSSIVTYSKKRARPWV